MEIQPIEQIPEERQGVSQSIPPDIFIYRFVVIVLGTIVLLIVSVGLVATFWDKALDQVFWTVAATALGALAGMLAPAPKRH